MARHIAARQNEPMVSVLLNHTVPASTAQVSRADFSSATQRAVLLELPFDATALVEAQNLGERLNPRSEFFKAISHLANDLSGVEQAAERPVRRWSRAAKLLHRKH